MHDFAKDAAAKAAANLLENGMIVGLGSGSTATLFIKHLIERCKNGLKISAVATSQKSYDQALAGNIKMLDIDTLTSIDIVVDGADEIDGQKRMIKGGGGALLREKIIASMSKEMVVVIDESKRVKNLGKFPLPVEILPFAYHATLYKLSQLGFHGALRKKNGNDLYVTDNGNYIYDISFTNGCQDPEKENAKLLNVAGVLETGFFFHLAGRVITGFNDGHVEIQP